MAPARKKTLTVTVLAIDESLPAAAQAAALALGVLTHAKQHTWGDLVVAVETQDQAAVTAMASLFLTAEQESVLEAWPGVAHTVRRKDGDTPRVTAAVCAECEEWVAVTSTAPSVCQMTDGCKGKYVKPRDASRKQVPFDEAPVRAEVTLRASDIYDHSPDGDLHAVPVSDTIESLADDATRATSVATDVGDVADDVVLFTDDTSPGPVALDAPGFSRGEECASPRHRAVYGVRHVCRGCST